MSEPEFTEFKNFQNRIRIYSVNPVNSGNSGRIYRIGEVVMKIRVAILAGLVLALVFSCSKIEFDNPCDPGGTKPDEAACALKAGIALPDAGSSSSSGVSSSSSGSSSSANSSSSSGALNDNSSSSDGSNSSVSSSSSALKDCPDAIIPSSHFCYDGVVYKKCSDISYDPTKYTCDNDVPTLAKCNNVSYNPLTQRCTSGNIVETKCGNGYYDALTHFCSDTKIYVKCGEKTYFPSMQYCSNGTVKNYGFMTDNGGKQYKAVEIGNQIWMAENLNYDTSTNGSVCPANSETNCTIYGRLYNWETAKGVCPKEWHLPSNTEWEDLMTAVGGSSTAGIKLKATSGWPAYYLAGNGTDDYGFAALPGGCAGTNAGSDFVGKYGYWWTATPSAAYAAYAYDRSISYDNNRVEEFANANKVYFYSVRCVKDSN
jgi:uncharacterized protein (TIGR02145 family)